MEADRTLSWDWYPGTIPQNAVVDDTAYIETTYSFSMYRSEAEVGTRIGKAASTYIGTMLDVGPRGQVIIGDYALVVGVRIVCDACVEIGDYALLSWNVILMDTYRMSFDKTQRRAQLEQAASSDPRRIEGDLEAKPIKVGRNSWIGFDSIVLPGVTIGEGAIVGARSVVAESVEPYTVVAGNPARVIRRLEV